MRSHLSSWSFTQHVKESTHELGPLLNLVVTHTDDRQVLSFSLNFVRSVRRSYHKEGHFRLSADIPRNCDTSSKPRLWTDKFLSMNLLVNIILQQLILVQGNPCQNYTGVVTHWTRKRSSSQIQVGHWDSYTLYWCKGAEDAIPSLITCGYICWNRQLWGHSAIYSSKGF